jgi:hypothetical protein
MKFPVLLAFALPLALISCSKSTDEPVKEACQISKITNNFTDGSKLFATLEYDNLNAPNKISFYEDSDQEAYESIIYNDNGIIMRDHEPGTETSEDDVTTYTYKNGLITSGGSSISTKTGDYIGTTKYDVTYEYNNDSNITKSTQVWSYSTNEPEGEEGHSTIVGTYTYENGNLVKYHAVTDYSSDLHYEHDIYYEYYTDKLSTRFTQYERGEDEYILYFAKISRNLIKKSTIVWGTPEPWIQNFSYTYDAEGRIIETTVIGKDDESDNDDSKKVLKLEYLCK